jgi:hypothetical protein
VKKNDKTNRKNQNTANNRYMANNRNAVDVRDNFDKKKAQSGVTQPHQAKKEGLGPNTYR